MKIAIDTSQDSPESIKKVIRLLHDLVNGPFSNDQIQTQSPAADAGIFNMFGPVQQSGPSPGSSASVAPSSAPSIFDVFKNDPPQSGNPPSGASVEEQGKEEVHAGKHPVRVKDSDVRAKKFQFPEDEISIIEY